MFTLKNIAEKLNLFFHTGDQNQLTDLMFETPDKLYEFRGERKGVPQFLQQVREVIPNVDTDKLYEDYHINARLIRAKYYFVRDFYKIYMKSFSNIEFLYEESYEPNLMSYSKEFKILDGLILPADDPFWHTYLPPNYFGDQCQVRRTQTDCSDKIPLNLPKVSNRFIIDRNRVFFDKYPFNTLDNHFLRQVEIKNTSILDINLLDLTFESFKEWVKQEYPNLTSEQLESYMEIFLAHFKEKQSNK